MIHSKRKVAPLLLGCLLLGSSESKLIVAASEPHGSQRDDSSLTRTGALNGPKDPKAFGGPDFSYAGRNTRAEEPPRVTTSTHAYFDVMSYGAIANDGVSDRDAVERAIAAAEAHPGPSVVFFPPGRFVLRDEDDVGAPTIHIRRSEVVFKGSGMEVGGTELFIESESFETFAITFRPELDPDVGWRGARTLTPLTRVPSFGDREIEVEDPRLLNVGDVVRLAAVLPDSFPEFRAFFYPYSDESLIREFFDYSSGSGRDWRSDFLSTLEIEAITGNRVRFREPLQADYQFVSPTYKGGPKLVQIYATGDDFLRDGGVEDLAFVSNYRDQFKHFHNRAADGYNCLDMSDVRECWVRRVRMCHATRGLHFRHNGKGNVVYDLVFEGNSGHYSMTVEGNVYGTQASFIREFAPTHHGFGATSSAYSTVYHRCNQFGGPEGHSGYPQATLYDLNEGDLSVPRMGGAPPHQSKYTVFWNWNQSLFIPLNSGVRGDGRYRETTLEGARIDFWPSLIMRPFVMGLHGVPLEIDQPQLDLEEYRSPNLKLFPESLFEAQLRSRLGEVPRWIEDRARSFEEVTRYSQVDIGFPGNDSVFALGQVLDLAIRLHPRFDAGHLGRIRLYAGRGHDLDFPEREVASTEDPTLETIRWKPAEPGPWRLRLELENSLGERVSSEPLMIFVEPASDEVSYLGAQDAWYQNRSMDARAISAASQDIIYQDLQQYHDEVRAIEKPLIEAMVDDSANREVAAGLIDGDLNGNATSGAALRYFGTKGLVFDLGSAQRVDFVELVAPIGSARVDYFGAFDLQVSSRPEAQYSYTNSDFTWRTVRRMGHAHTTTKLPMSPLRTYRIHLPESTKARYLRLVIRTLDSKARNEGNLSEIRFGRYESLHELR